MEKRGSKPRSGAGTLGLRAGTVTPRCKGTAKPGSAVS